MKLKLKFVLLTQDRAEDDLCTISLRIYYNRKYRYKESGIQVLRKQFDIEEAKKAGYYVVKDHKDQDQHNEDLSILASNARTAYRKMKQKGEIVTARSLKQKLDYEGQPALKIFEDVVKKSRRLSESSKEGFQTVITRLTEFDKDIKIEQINYDFAKRFESFLMKRPGRHGGMLNINTVNKYLGDLKNLLSMAMNYELITHNKLQNYERIIEHKSKTILTESYTYEEIRFIENITADILQAKYNMTIQKSKSIMKTFQLILLGYYTSLRLGNLLVITPNDLKEDGWIRVIELKNDRIRKKPKWIEIPIGSLFDGKGLVLFRKLSRFNPGSTPVFGGERKRTLHQGNMRIIQLLFFPGKKVSIHSSRHTFKTHLQKKLSMYAINKMMGHRTMSTTEEYGEDSFDSVKREVEKVFRKTE